MKRYMMILLFFGIIMGLIGCSSKEDDTTIEDLEARVAKLETQYAELLKERQTEAESENVESITIEENSIISEDEVDAYINTLYGDKSKLKDTEDYSYVAYFVDNQQIPIYYILRDIDNDGIRELYMSDSQTSDTQWWCILDYVNEEVIILKTYESDSTVQKSALLNNNMIYQYARSGLSMDAIYSGMYVSDGLLGENNGYSLYFLNMDRTLQLELELFCQSDVVQGDIKMPNLYYLQGEPVSYEEWATTLNQYIISQEIKAEEYTILSEENLRLN